MQLLAQTDRQEAGNNEAADGDVYQQCRHRRRPGSAVIKAFHRTGHGIAAAFLKPCRTAGA